MAEQAFLGTGLFLVAARAADQGIEAEFLDRFQQGDGLVRVAAFVRARQAHGAACHRILHAAHDQVGLQFGSALVTEGGHFGEVVAGVDHQQREGDAAAAERLFCAGEQHQRVLATGEQQGGTFEAGSNFAQQEDGFLFQGVQVG